MFWKVSCRCLAAEKKKKKKKKKKVSTLLLSIQNIIIIIINLFCHEFKVSKCSAQRKIFVISCVFNIMQFDSMLQNFFNCSYHNSTSLLTKIIKHFSHWAFTCSKLTIETQQQGAKYVQS